MKILTFFLLICSVIASYAAEDVLVSNARDDLANVTSISQVGYTISDVAVEYAGNGKDNSAIITQAGGQNIVNVVVSGDENKIQSIQSGNENTANMNIAGNSGQSITLGDLHLEAAVMINQNGDHNSASITIESGDNNQAAIYQTGDMSIAEILQKNGSANRAWIEQGENNHASITQSGNGNSATIIQH